MARFLLRKRFVSFLLLFSAGLAGLWLALPGLLGWALGAWLVLPGVSDLRVEVGRLGLGQAQIRALSARVTTPAGDQAQLALNNIELRYSLSRRHVDHLAIATAKLELRPAEVPPQGDWPRLSLPELPVSRLTVGDLEVQLFPPGRPPLVTHLALALEQGAQAAWSGQLENASGRLQLGLRRDADWLLAAEWLPRRGEGGRATLRFAEQPNQKPVQLLADLPAAGLAQLAQFWLGIVHPGEKPVERLSSAGGRLHVNALIVLGAQKGQLESAHAEIGLSALRAQVQAGAMPVQLAGEGQLLLDARQGAIGLTLQPGFQLRADGAGAFPWQASIDPKAVFALRLGGPPEAPATAQTPLPITLKFPGWASGEARLVGLTLHTEGASLMPTTARAEVRFSGSLADRKSARWVGKGMAGDGALHLNWSVTQGLRAQLEAGLRARELHLPGSLPVTLLKPGGNLQAGLEAKVREGRWVLAGVNGHWQMPALSVRLGSTDQPFRTGPLELRLVDAALEERRAKLSLKLEQTRSEQPAYADWPAPTLNAEMQLAGELLKAHGALELRNLPLLNWSAIHALTKRCGSAQGSVQFALPALGQALQPLPRALRPLVLSAGSASGQGKGAWCLAGGAAPASWSASASLQVRDAGLAWDKARAEGLLVDLQVPSLAPLQGSLRLNLPHAELGLGLPVDDTVLEVALTPAQWKLQSLQTRLFGGSLSGATQELKRPLGEEPLLMTVRNMDLAQILATVKLEGLSGSGRLDGSLPVVLHPGGIEIREGKLQSQTAGVLKYAPVVPVADNPGLQALRNFQYRELGMGLQYDPDGRYRVRLQLDGKNPEFYGGTPVRFKLNVNGALPGLFRAAVFSGDFNRHILEQLQSGKLR